MMGYKFHFLVYWVSDTFFTPNSRAYFPVLTRREGCNSGLHSLPKALPQTFHQCSIFRSAYSNLVLSKCVSLQFLQFSVNMVQIVLTGNYRSWDPIIQTVLVWRMLIWKYYFFTCFSARCELYLLIAGN